MTALIGGRCSFAAKKLPMLCTKVKVSAVTNLSDARYCAGMGVEWIGFSMDSVPPQQYNEIRGWLAGVQVVGETEATTPEQVLALVETFRPDVLQISHVALVEPLRRLGLPLMLRCDLADGLPAALPETDLLLVESSDAFAVLNPPTVAYLRDVAARQPLLVGFGLKESNVLEVLREISPEGLALYGAAEQRPGFKDFGELMDVLETLETDD